MFKKYYISFFVILLFFSYILSINNSLTDSFTWPIPDCKTITSYFGFRIHPTTFKTSYHSGIDIRASQNTPIYSICNGIVSFTGFNGPYGYSIIIKNNEYEILYAHVSPDFIININDIITTNQIIGKVGPKYINNFSGNKYFDSNRQCY